MDPNTKIVLCDLDGTLASSQWRDHLVEGDKKYYPEYYRGIPFDNVIPDVMNMLKDHKQQGCEIIYITAREEVLSETQKRPGGEVNKETLPVRKWTLDWLTKHGAPKGLLIMRKHKDSRPSSVVKMEMVKEVVGKNIANVVLALDDNKHVIEMYKSMGIENAILVDDPGISPNISNQHDKFMSNLPIAKLLVKAARIIDGK